MLKKFIAPIFAVVLALSTLGASVGVALAKTNEHNEGCATETLTLGEKTSLTQGRVGVSTPSSAWAGELDVCNDSTMRHERSKDQGLVFESPKMDWAVEKNEKTNVAFNHGNASVFFSDLTAAQMKDWKAGNLAIYHWNAPTKTWIKLPTTSVRGTELDARATGYGFYVLAKEASSAK